MLPALLAVEHGVERSHLVHLHLVLPDDLGHLLHGRQRQPASVLQGHVGQAGSRASRWASNRTAGEAGKQVGM